MTMLAPDLVIASHLVDRAEAVGVDLTKMLAPLRMLRGNAHTDALAEDDAKVAARAVRDLIGAVQTTRNFATAKITAVAVADLVAAASVSAEKMRE